ncbi:unnamed protein product [Spirodela intermedia]|uniref:Uncharacterized protein n=1 Tax=Spirodela intermedia TaxID=51605 RepID=A0A7I8KNT7_SPIIN|nr:unnamed protein product [Spirodela intermedia]
MGACNSCEVTAACSTAKVIAEDGRLLEFAAPVKVFQVLLKSPGSFFICDADDMDFEDYVREVGEEEELQPGQIYFVLPRSMLRRRLHSEEMAALAVKASAALVKSGCAAAFGGHLGEGEELRRSVSSCSPSEPTAGQRRSRKGSGSGRNFPPRLGAIPEFSSHD